MRNTDDFACAIGLSRPVLHALLALILSGFSLTATLAQPPAPPPDDAPDDAIPRVVPRRTTPLSTQWTVPPGLSLDARERVLRFMSIQSEVARTPPDKVDWLQELQELKTILAHESDTLISPLTMWQPGIGVEANLFERPRISLKQAVTEFLANLPPAGKDVWRQLYADTAEAQLRVASATGSERALAAIASEFVETPAGWQATEQLGVRNLDAQRPVVAIRYLERLRQSPAARRDREPRLSLTIATAWLQLQRDDRAGLVLAELNTWLQETFPGDASAAGSSEQADAIRRITGTSTRDLLASLRESVPDVPAVDDVINDWRQPSGAVTNSASVAAVAATGPVLWRSFTDGFSERATAADRAPFATPWADYDEEPYPQTPAQMAGMVELALQYLDRIDIEESQVGLPVGQPLLVGELAVLRTLDRVRAVDVATGSVVWESFQQDPAFEEQFSLRTAKQALNFPRAEIRSPVNQAQEALLLARTRLDRTTGTLSSDGQRVYFVNGGGVASRATRLGMARLVEIIPKSWNTLRAVDLATGRLLWEVGGASDTPRLPGAGRFFLGPPTCLDDGVYVTAEDDGHAILLRLDPATGATAWQQELGEVISPAINEAARRITGEAPVVADGLLICTTSSGQVYAVAPDEQRIVWMTSYPSAVPPPERLPVTMRMRAQPMNTDLQDDLNRWRETQAAASNGRLVFCAVDSSVLTCLDVVTGDVLWKQPRNDALFIAAVHADRVVLAGEYGVRALDLKSGETQWSVAFEGRVPSGHGVRSGNVLHLPVAVVISPEAAQRRAAVDGQAAPPANLADAASNLFDALESATMLPPIASLEGAVLSLDLSTGHVLAESPVPDGLRLGNLAAADGRLIAQNFDSVLAFESLTEQQTRLAQLTDPQPAALLAQARQRLHNGDRGGMDNLLQALELLSKTERTTDAAAARETADLQRSAEQLLIGQILEMARRNEVLDDRLFALLDRIPLDASSQLTMQRVKIDSLLREQQFAAAFGQLLRLTETAQAMQEADGVRHTLTDAGITQPLSRWITGQLAAAYRSAAVAEDSAAQVADIEARITAERERAEQAPTADRPEQLEAWLQQFGWHASATDIRLQLAADQPAEKLQSIEQWLAPLIASEHGRSAAQAQAALTAAYARSGRGDAALNARRELQRRIRQHGIAADAPLWNGLTLTQLKEQWVTSDGVRTALAAEQWPPSAPTETLKETSDEADPLRRFVERIGPSSAPFDGWTLELTSQGLRAIDADGRTPWTIPAEDIPDFPDTVRQRFRAVWLTGGSLLAIVINADMAVFDASSSPPRRLWSQSLIANDPALLPFGQKSFEFGMLVSTYRLRSGSRALASVDLLTPTTFVWRSSNRLHVVDARTGDLLWERPAPSGEGFVLGDDRLLVLAETGPSQSRVFETATGRLLATFELPERTFLVSADDAAPVFVTPGPDSIEFFGLDVLTGQKRWQFASDRSTVTLPFESYLVTLQSQGQLQVRDLRDGTLLADLKIQPPPEQLNQLQFHATPTGFVLFTSAPTARFRFGINRLDTQAKESTPVNGYACGVDLQQPRILWEADLPATFLPKPQPRNLPVVLLASSHTRTDDGVNLQKPRYELTVLDTRTGKPAASYSTDEPFRDVDARRSESAGPLPQRLDIRVSNTAQPMTMTLDYAKAAE